MHNLQIHISHFQDFIFDLNIVNEPASLYSDGNFAQIIGALYVTARRYSLKSGALKNFTNFTGKQLLEPFLIKFQAFRLEAGNFFPKKTPWRSSWNLQRKCFPVTFAKSAGISFCTKQF